MAIKKVGSLFGNFRGKVIDNINLTDSEAQVAGTAYKLSSSKWTKAATTARIYGIGVKAIAAGTDVKGLVEMVLPGDVLECDYVGTADAGFVVGCETAILDSGGANVNAASVTGGHLIILGIDATNKKVYVTPTKTFLNDDTTA